MKHLLDELERASVRLALAELEVEEARMHRDGLRRQLEAVLVPTFRDPVARERAAFIEGAAQMPPDFDSLTLAEKICWHLDAEEDDGALKGRLDGLDIPAHRTADHLVVFGKSLRWTVDSAGDGCWAFDGDQNLWDHEAVAAWIAERARIKVRGGTDD